MIKIRSSIGNHFIKGDSSSDKLRLLRAIYLEFGIEIIQEIIYLLDINQEEWGTITK